MPQRDFAQIPVEVEKPERIWKLSADQLVSPVGVLSHPTIGLHE